MAQTQQLVIIRRNQFATFALLAQAFADEPNVRLVWDRRTRERRKPPATPEGDERRSGDRRRDPWLSWGTNDYLLLTLTEPAAPARRLANPAAAHDAESPEHKRALNDIGRDIEAAARSDLSVLISGGDAVSRKSLAHRIHRRSIRSTRPFVVLDRQAFVDLFLSDGRHQSRANAVQGGTLLIEEIAQWNWQQQSELVRFLERLGQAHTGSNQGPGPRLISGTDEWLFDRIASQEFRADLFYRLNGIHLVLPPGITSLSA